MADAPERSPMKNTQYALPPRALHDAFTCFERETLDARRAYSAARDKLGPYWACRTREVIDAYNAALAPLTEVYLAAIREPQERYLRRVDAYIAYALARVPEDVVRQRLGDAEVAAFFERRAREKPRG